jgi:hypothetical protein
MDSRVCVEVHDSWLFLQALYILWQHLFQASYVVGISEMEQVGKTFRLPTATDGDVTSVNRVQRYALEPSFPEFELSAVQHTTLSGGEQFTVSLRLVAKVDRSVLQL